MSRQYILVSDCEKKMESNERGIKNEKCSRNTFGAFEWTDKTPLIFKQDE